MEKFGQGKKNTHLGWFLSFKLLEMVTPIKPHEIVKTLECRWDVSGVPYQLVSRICPSNSPSEIMSIEKNSDTGK